MRKYDWIVLLIQLAILVVVLAIAVFMYTLIMNSSMPDWLKWLLLK